jgi:hypothetical protein
MSKHAHGKGRTTSRKIRRLMFTGIIVAVVALGATAAVSLRTRQLKSSTPSLSKANAQTKQTPADLRYQVGSVPVYPQTGLVRPLTQEEAERLAANLKRLVNQSTEGLKEVHHADGSISMDLQGRFQSLAVRKQNENGEWVVSCVDSPEAAAAFFDIDPALVGVKKNATAAHVTPNTNSATKGEVR